MRASRTSSVAESGGQTNTASTGVMRFLQIEWHNHERARNAWDIERAEMKAKIAKQEGEVRHAKKLNEQLERQIRMLEMALKNERAKSRGKATLEEPKDAQKERDSKRDSRMGRTDLSRGHIRGLQARSLALFWLTVMNRTEYGATQLLPRHRVTSAEPGRQG